MNETEISWTADRVTDGLLNGSLAPAVLSTSVSLSVCVQLNISSLTVYKNQLARGNDSVPKIITNDTINLFSKTAIGILVTSNNRPNSFRVLFDEITSVYFI